MLIGTSMPPSYQLLTITYPIVGNYGVPDDITDEYGLPAFFESDMVQVAALIVSDYSHHHSHWASMRSLSQWLIEHRVPALYGLDTRLLTKKIREKGALKAYIEFEPNVVMGEKSKERLLSRSPNPPPEPDPPGSSSLPRSLTNVFSPSTSQLLL